MDHITTTTISGTSTNTVEWSNLDTATYSSYYVTWEVQANASGLTNQELTGVYRLKLGMLSRVTE